MKTTFRNISAVAMVSVLMGIGMSQSAFAGKNPSVFPPESHPYGKTYGEWAAAWWQWVSSFPADSNPLFDETGELTAVGQSGNVWFLVGTTGPGDTSATRTATIPVGKALFFPIVNTIFITTPGDPGIDEIRELVREVTDAVTDLACEIDGKPVQNIEQYREVSPVFSVNLPANNIFGIEAGEYAPDVDEGFYLLLPPLKVGEHTIHFHGNSPFFEFTLDVTYHLTVEP